MKFLLALLGYLLVSVNTSPIEKRGVVESLSAAPDGWVQVREALSRDDHLIDIARLLELNPALISN